jgi:hypothetical protein
MPKSEKGITPKAATDPVNTGLKHIFKKRNKKFGRLKKK